MSIATEAKVERLLLRVDELEIELSELRARVKTLEDERGKEANGGRPSLSKK